MWAQISQLIFSCHTNSDTSNLKHNCLKTKNLAKTKKNRGLFLLPKKTEKRLNIKPSGSNGLCQRKTNSLVTSGTVLLGTASIVPPASRTQCLHHGCRCLLTSTLAKTRRCARSCSSWRLAGCWTGVVWWSVKWFILVFSRRLVHFCVSWGNRYLGN